MFGNYFFLPVLMLKEYQKINDIVIFCKSDNYAFVKRVEVFIFVHLLSISEHIYGTGKCL